MKIFYSLLLLLMPMTILSAQDMPTVGSANETFDNVTSVTVIGEFCKVDVKVGDKTTLTGELKAAKEIDGYAIAFTNEAGILTVEAKKPESGWTSHSGFINLTIQEGTKLNVKTTSGYITIVGVQGADVIAESKSGKIAAKDIVGNVTLKSKSASVKAVNITGQLNVSTKGGAQVVDQIDGAITMYSGSGDMLINNVKGSLKTESSDGDQTIKDIDGEVNLKTRSGAMKLSNAKGVINSLSAAGTLNLFDVTGVLNLTSTKGAIIGNRVRLSESSNFNTTEGKIKLKLDNPKESFTFLCQSESSYIVAFGKSKKKKLKVGDGPIVITAISTTGAQSYY